VVLVVLADLSARPLLLGFNDYSDQQEEDDVYVDLKNNHHADPKIK
jgi:hypothetical protein